MATTDQKEFKFYGNALCPFAHRSWWAALEKQVPIEFIHIPLGAEKPEWYAATINPRGTVPTVVHGDKKVFESLIIAEFFEDAFPGQGTSLLPKDPHKRAAVRFFIDEFGQSISTFYVLLKNQDRSKDEELKAAVVAKLKSVVNLLKATSDGPYVLGEEFSLADIAAIPFLERFAAVLKHYRDFDPLDVDERLRAWHHASSSRPAFKETTRPAEFFIQGYASYANANN